MFLTKRATSIIEAIVVLFIVVSWVVWMYQVFWNSQKLSNSTAKKIQAIQIAREWIEAVKNIRDTNWLLFGSDSTNCWNVLDYDNTCVWDTWTSTDIQHNKSYIIFQDTYNRWRLYEEASPADWFKLTSYKDNFEVFQDNEWFFTQTWTINTTKFKLKPLFTREIKFEYLEDWLISWFTNSNEEKIKVTSLVQWTDSSSENIHKVEFVSVLTNWKIKK